MQLFGRKIGMPVVIGPTGFNGMVTKDGDSKLARAAAAHGIPFALSTVSTVPLEDIAKIPGGWPWMQIYFFRDRTFVRNLVERCAAARSPSLAVTKDRSAERRAGKERDQ